MFKKQTKKKNPQQPSVNLELFYSFLIMIVLNEDFSNVVVSFNKQNCFHRNIKYHRNISFLIINIIKNILMYFIDIN